MADSIRPAIKRAPSSATFYKVRFPSRVNSDSDALGVIYPLFFLGCVIIAVAIFLIRSKQTGAINAPGLLVEQDPVAALELLPNITQRINQQAAGTYDPSGSTATSASYPGVIY